MNNLLSCNMPKEEYLCLFTCTYKVDLIVKL